MIGIKENITFEEGMTTISLLFKEMLNMAEEQFGKSNFGWFFTGIEFKNDYPHILYYDDKFTIVLSTGCFHIPYLADNFQQLCYQLSHEVCHSLYLAGSKEKSNVLNEGISAYFSIVYDKHRYKNSTYAIDCNKKSIYYDAYKLVDKLLSSDRDAIKKIRKIKPIISTVSIDNLILYSKKNSLREY